MLWFKVKYNVKIKVKKYCERKTKTKNEIQQTNGQGTHAVLAQNSEGKRDTPDRKVLLSALEETTLK